MSKNTALTVLNCLLNQLTSLDVSKNIELEHLDCEENKLTSFDVSKNTKLKTLNCLVNQLTSLNVSGCTALEALYCDGNDQLKTLNVSGCTALKELWCSGSQLTSLNVSGCSALTKLDCDGNQLSSLNLSGCTALEKINCFLNKIKDAGMDVLVESLPTVNEGKMYAIYSEEDGNVMTTTQVATAKAKGWNVYYFDGSWKEYAGEDPDGIGNVNENDNFNDVYDLSGRRIASPRKGVNIINGRKVLVK